MSHGVVTKELTGAPLVPAAAHDVDGALPSFLGKLAGEHEQLDELMLHLLMEEKKRGGDSVDGGIDGNGEGSGAAAPLDEQDGGGRPPRTRVGGEVSEGGGSVTTYDL